MRVASPQDAMQRPFREERPIWSFPTGMKRSAAAIGMAKPGDVVVLAGKGHEDYQIIGDRKIHFDDREVAREEIRKRKERDAMRNADARHRSTSSSCGMRDRELRC